MAADNKIMEALARIEHKLDLLLKIDTIRHPIKKGELGLPLPTVGDANHLCPVCDQIVEYQIDITEGVVFRKCGCKTGKIALNMGAFAPTLPTKKTEKEEDNGGTNQEDRRNPNRGGGPQRR